MKVMETKIIFWKFLLLLWINQAHSSISGISYLDPIKMGSIKSKLLAGEDPCNPLYWYSRNIPDFCTSPSTVQPYNAGPDEPLAGRPMLPAPPAPPLLEQNSPPQVPKLPPTLPILPLLPILPPSLPILPPPMPILPPPMPILPPTIIAGPPPLPLFPAPPSAPVISIPSNPYPISNPLTYYPTLQQRLTGFVPGMQGLVTKDGGINVMPFSDAYADMLEKHKNKIIRKKLHKILDKYENYPYSRDYGKLRKYEKYFTDDSY